MLSIICVFYFGTPGKRIRIMLNWEINSKKELWETTLRPFYCC